jgi:hypothetical protein
MSVYHEIHDCVTWGNQGLKEEGRQILGNEEFSWRDMSHMS